MNEFFRRIYYLLNRRRLDRELANDMEFHREMAARTEHGNFGNTLRLREEARDAWGWTWLDRFGQDVRYAVRMVRRAPAFSLAAVLMLAIGIGVNVAVFGFFDLVVLRPLNVRDPGSLVRLHRRSLENYAYALSYPEMAFVAAHSKSLSAVLGVNATKLSVEGEEKQLLVQFVTANLFRELGAQPELGRTFDPDDRGSAITEPVVVLSDGFWRRHFGANQSVIGKTIRLNGKPATIIGVAPREFSGLSIAEPTLWAPITQQPFYVSGSRLLTDFSTESPGAQVWGRLQPGITPRVAEQELTSLASELHRLHPADIWDKERLLTEPGGYATSMTIASRRGTGSENRNELYEIFGLAAALVLLILAVACGNLGSLLLARGVVRQREIAIRSSVGAGRGRLIRQLFTESLLLALAGSAAGLGLGYVVLRVLLSVTGGPSWLDPTPDWRVAAFSIGMGFLSALLFGLSPAWQIARQRLHTTMLRQVLVGAQVAASCILLIVAGLLGRALENTLSADPGFDYRHVLTINPGLSSSGYTPERARAYVDALEHRLQSLPGVESQGLALLPPLGNGSMSAGIRIDGRSLTMMLNHVDPDFFRTMKIPLLRGRNFRRGDAREVVIGESLARSAWPGQDPLGKTISIDGDYVVIGVAGTARMIKPQDSNSVEVYFPIKTEDYPGLSVILRTAGPPEDLLRAAQIAAKAVDPDTFAEVVLLKNGYRRTLENAQNSALAVSLFGSVAHLLACLGILGVVSYAVSQRTKEIGIRISLGASKAAILRIVLRQLSTPVVVGLAVGIGGAAAISQFLRGMLYGVSNLDPISYAGAVAVFVITVGLAAVLPARRALRVDPMRALRYD